MSRRAIVVVRSSPGTSIESACSVSCRRHGTIRPQPPRPARPAQITSIAICCPVLVTSWPDPKYQRPISAPTNRGADIATNAIFQPRDTK